MDSPMKSSSKKGGDANTPRTDGSKSKIFGKPVEIMQSK